MWCVCYGFELASPTLDRKLLWAQLVYVGTTAVPVAWMVFVSDFTRGRGRMHFLQVVVLSIIPAITLVLVLTNGLNGFMWRDVGLRTVDGHFFLQFTAGPWYRVWTIYGLGLYGFATLVLLRAALHAQHFLRTQHFILLAAAVLPAVGNIFWLSSIGPIPHVDLTPLGFGVSAMLIAWSLFRFGFLDVVPVARENVFDELGEGVLVLDWRGRVVDMNPAAEGIIGETAEQALGKLLDDVLPAASEVVRKSRLGEHSAWGDVEIVHGEGEARRWYELRLSPLQDRGRRLAGDLVVIRDVTERIETARSLAEARDQALAADRAKSEFLATISHEIRTPMNGIIGLTDILLDTELGVEQREFAERVRSAGMSLLTILNDILDFSKMEAGKMDLDSRPFDLRTCFEQAIDLVADGVQEKGLELACLVSPEIPPVVVGDAGRVRQIVLNLLSNAAKFTEEGEIVVRVFRASSDSRSVTIRCEVGDTGIGIPEEAQQNLFERFSQVDRSDSSRFGGTGLGLAIVRSLVEQMEGQVGLRSYPERGSTFWFTLRLAVDPSQRSVQTSEFAGRILAVEDHPASRLQLVEQLGSLGFECEAVESADEACEILATSTNDQFSLVLVDNSLEEAGGRSATQAVVSAAGKVPVVLLAPMTQGRSLGSENGTGGVSGVIHKPVRRAHLRARIAALLYKEID